MSFGWSKARHNATKHSSFSKDSNMHVFNNFNIEKIPLTFDPGDPCWYLRRSSFIRSLGWSSILAESLEPNGCVKSDRYTFCSSSYRTGVWKNKNVSYKSHNIRSLRQKIKQNAFSVAMIIMFRHQDNHNLHITCPQLLGRAQLWWNGSGAGVHLHLVQQNVFSPSRCRLQKEQ